MLVGNELGFSDGAGIGGIVGELEGICELDGEDVGRGHGKLVGVSDGIDGIDGAVEIVGKPDGENVGALVTREGAGVIEGMGVGVSVGSGDGACVGLSVGIGVGDCVGMIDGL